MQYDLKKILAIIYLNTYSDAYELNELKELLGLNISQLKEFISSLISEDLIKNEETLHLTDKSSNILLKMGLEDVDINSLMDDKKTINVSHDKLTFDDIYIPKNFKL